MEVPTAEEAIIKQYNKLHPSEKAENLLEALEGFYLEGGSDEFSGDVDSVTGHFYRIERWIVRTDDRGFHYLDEYETTQEAEGEFQQLVKLYDAWEND